MTPDPAIIDELTARVREAKARYRQACLDIATAKDELRAYINHPSWKLPTAALLKYAERLNADLTASEDKP